MTSNRKCKTRGCSTLVRVKFKRKCSVCRSKNLKKRKNLPKKGKSSIDKYKPIKSSMKLKHIGYDKLKAESRKCKCCKSWIQHYKNNFSGPMPKTCADFECRKKPTHGAHVKRVGKSFKDSWHIVPTCNGHNRGKSNIFKSKKRKLVRIKKQQNCKK